MRVSLGTSAETESRGETRVASVRTVAAPCCVGKVPPCRAAPVSKAKESNVESGSKSRMVEVAILGPAEVTAAA